LRKDDRTLRFLLSGGRLSGADHDKILARVLPSPSSGFRSWRFAIGTLTLAATAATALVFVFQRLEPRARTPWMATKGEAGAVLSVQCLSRPGGTCRRGDRLLFAADGMTEGGLLAAYADGPAGERIWYFPAADGHLATVPPHEGSSVARETAEIGEEHPFGRYTLHLFLLAGPTDRATLLEGRAPVKAKAITGLKVAP
jgi:hypothetical protein